MTCVLDETWEFKASTPGNLDEYIQDGAYKFVFFNTEIFKCIQEQERVTWIPMKSLLSYQSMGTLGSTHPSLTHDLKHVSDITSFYLNMLQYGSWSDKSYHSDIITNKKKLKLGIYTLMCQNVTQKSWDSMESLKICHVILGWLVWEYVCLLLFMFSCEHPWIMPRLCSVMC